MLSPEISRIAALIAQNLSFDERDKLANDIFNAISLNDISEPYQTEIFNLLNDNKVRHLPGQHDQLTHGSGGKSNYKAGAWRKANAIDRKSILEARYGEMADYAIERGKTSLSREEIIKEAARVDENNLTKRNSEVWINGSNHTISFTGDAKNMSEDDRKLLFNNIDNLQTKYPVDQMDVEVVKDWRNVRGMSKASASGATTNDGKKIYLKYNAVTGINAERPEDLAALGIQSPWKQSEGFMGALSTSPVASYVTAHEWGHAVESQTIRERLNMGLASSVIYETQKNSVAAAIQRGVNKKGFMSTYGKSSDAESFAEAFADNFLTNGKSSNAVTQEFKKEFQWK